MPRLYRFMALFLSHIIILLYFRKSNLPVVFLPVHTISFKWLLKLRLELQIRSNLLLPDSISLRSLSNFSNVVIVFSNYVANSDGYGCKRSAHLLNKVGKT